MWQFPRYLSALGQPLFEPRMMMTVRLHCYAGGIYSSQRRVNDHLNRTQFCKLAAAA
ncbi:hypothetical protein [Bradyrhizobium sp. RDI18]|uniref:hypothetical protein n=1 Tax=Bradyrhizobium sp. RDI18 TaxID=3367400 RepID=UPI00371A89B8